MVECLRQKKRDIWVIICWLLISTFFKLKINMLILIAKHLTISHFITHQFSINRFLNNFQQSSFFDRNNTSFLHTLIIFIISFPKHYFPEASLRISGLTTCATGSSTTSVFAASSVVIPPVVVVSVTATSFTPFFLNTASFTELSP